MAIEFQVQPDDDPEFLALVEQTVWGVLLEQRVEECLLTRIDNWFDHKWLGFSGNSVIEYPIARNEVALQELHSARVTLPPFRPNRVVDQRWYRWEGYLGRFVATPKRSSVHRNQDSQRNLRRFAADLAPSIALVWFSGRSEGNGQGSLMVYTCRAGEVDSWYTSWARRGSWVLDQLKGTAREPLLRLQERGRAQLEERRAQLPEEEQALCNRLHRAIADAQLSEALDWVAADANLEGRDHEGRTPLLHAVQRAQWDLVQILLGQGANPFQQDLEGWGVLHLCAWKGGEQARVHLQKFLDQGVSTEARTDLGDTPLMLAVEGGDLDAAQLLLAAGADLEARDRRGNTPLHLAACRRLPEATTWLIAAGAKIGHRNKVRFTPLLAAAWAGDAESIRRLHAAGAQLSPRDKHGNTPLFWVRRLGHDESLQALLELGATE